MSGPRRSGGRSGADSAAERASRDEPAGFDALFAGLDAADGDEPADRGERGGRARSPRKAEKPKKPTKPTRAEKAAAKREAAAKAAGPRRGGAVPSASDVDGDLALLVSGAGRSATAGLLGAATASTATGAIGAAATVGAAANAAGALPGAAAAGAAGGSALAGAASAARVVSTTPDALRAAPEPRFDPPAPRFDVPEARFDAPAPEARRPEASAPVFPVPPADTTAGFATAIAAAAGALPGADPTTAPAPAPLNLDDLVRHGGRAADPAQPMPADVTGVSDLLDFGPSPDEAPNPVAGRSVSRRASREATTSRGASTSRDAARAVAPARRLGAQAAVRPAPRPAASAPRRRRGARQLASLVAMSFAALLAVATTIPSLSLLSPEDVQALAMADSIGMTEDGQHVEIDGDVVAQSVQREGYEHQSMDEYARAAGIRAEADFINNPAGTIQWPFAVGVHIGDRFGYRDCYGCSSDHGGQDFNPGLGAEIQAIADGTVAVSTDSGGSLGVVMMIDHMIDGELVTSVYAHMEYDSRRFEVGDTVHVADVIGTTGDTGMSTGPHLHFEIRLGGVDGTKVDPLEWLYANTN